MFKRFVTFTLMITLLQTSAGAAFPRDHVSSEKSPVEQVKAKVLKKGLGKKVVVKLKDGSRLKGFISQIGTDNFDITDSKTGKVTSLEYVNVTSVSDQGGLSLLAKVGIGIGIVVGALALLYGVACNNDPYC